VVVFGTGGPPTPGPSSDTLAWRGYAGSREENPQQKSESITRQDTVHEAAGTQGCI